MYGKKYQTIIDIKINSDVMVRTTNYKQFSNDTKDLNKSLPTNKESIWSKA
jgi:hypothetical protein